MAFAIIQRTTKGRDYGITHIALVDRSKTKKRWWTSDNPRFIFKYHYEKAARDKNRTLGVGRVVDYGYAYALIARQQRKIIEIEDQRITEEATGEMSGGWDEHKYS